MYSYTCTPIQSFKSPFSQKTLEVTEFYFIIINSSSYVQKTQIPLNLAAFFKNS